MKIHPLQAGANTPKKSIWIVLKFGTGSKPTKCGKNLPVMLLAPSIIARTSVRKDRVRFRDFWAYNQIPIHTEFEIEHILESRINDGVKQFLVHWSGGWGHDLDEWIGRTELVETAAEMVNKFEAKEQREQETEDEEEVDEEWFEIFKIFH